MSNASFTIRMKKTAAGPEGTWNAGAHRRVTRATGDELVQAFAAEWEPPLTEQLRELDAEQSEDERADADGSGGGDTDSNDGDEGAGASTGQESGDAEPTGSTPTTNSEGAAAPEPPLTEQVAPETGGERSGTDEPKVETATRSPGETATRTRRGTTTPAGS